MQRIVFLVKGSATEPYTTEFVRRSDTNISAYCTCKAGQNGMYCKHRFNILEGKTKGIISDNLDDVEIVKSWLPGSDVEKALFEVKKLETEVTRVKKLLTAAKKQVAKTMRE